MLAPLHMCKTCVAWYSNEAFPDEDACSSCQPYLGYNPKVFKVHCNAAADPPVCEFINVGCRKRSCPRASFTGLPTAHRLLERTE